MSLCSRVFLQWSQFSPIYYKTETLLSFPPLLSKQNSRTLPSPKVSNNKAAAFGSKTSLNTSDGGYKSMYEAGQNASDSVNSDKSGRSSRERTSTSHKKLKDHNKTGSTSQASQNNQLVKVDKDKRQISLKGNSNRHPSEFDTTLPPTPCTPANSLALTTTTNNLVMGLSETKKDLVKLEKNSRRILQGVVGRVEPFANSVNKIVMDNSRLKQEVTWLYCLEGVSIGSSIKKSKC